MSGKWHLGYNRPHWPVDRGFDRSFTVLEGTMNYCGHGSLNTGKIEDPPMAVDGKTYTPPWEGFFATEAFTDFAVRFVADKQEEARPFSFCLSNTAPHWPSMRQTKDLFQMRSEAHA